MQTLRDEHVTHALRHWSHFLVIYCKQAVQLLNVVDHVEAIRIGLSLVTIRHVHHLYQGAAVDALHAILQDRHVHRGVRFLEVFRLVPTFKHIDLNIVVVEVRDVTV